MGAKNELLYTKEHEWVRVEGNKAYIGITDYAQESLGDIVFVELPEEETVLSVGDTIGAVESVKAASDIYSPVSGTVVEINTALEDAPDLINKKPYENHIVVVEMEDISELDSLLNSDDYRAFCEEE